MKRIIRKRICTFALVAILALTFSFGALAESPPAEEAGPNSTEDASLAGATADEDASLAKEFLASNQVGAAIGPAPEPTALDIQKANEADQYYDAKMSGNYELAASYLMKQSADQKMSTKSALIADEPVMTLSEAIDTAATTKKVLYHIKQSPQKSENWCGFAVLRSIARADGVTKTQSAICKEIYNTTSKTQSLAWYTDQTKLDRTASYPSTRFLNSQGLGFLWAPFPMGYAGANPASRSTLHKKIVSTIDKGHGCMALGHSAPPQKLHSYYPNYSVWHWVGIRGYGPTYKSYIFDPAYSEHVSWGLLIDDYYSVTGNTLTEFVKTRGIVY